MPTLILTPRYTDDSQVLWRVAIDLGWEVERLARWEVPAHLLEVAEPVLYLEALTLLTDRGCLSFWNKNIWGHVPDRPKTTEVAIWDGLASKILAVHRGWLSAGHDLVYP